MTAETPTRFAGVAGRIVLILSPSLVACQHEPSSARPDPVELADVLDEPLDSLSGSAAEIVCREDAARFDPCVAPAMARSSEAECRAELERCDAATADSSFAPPCSAYDLGPPGACSIRVEEYLACVDAWNEGESCANVYEEGD
jgi:hypothetical protein